MPAMDNRQSKDRPAHPEKPSGVAHAAMDSGRAMTQDELEAHGYPRNFHELRGPAKRKVIAEMEEAAAANTKLGDPDPHHPEPHHPEPEPEPDGDGPGEKGVDDDGTVHESDAPPQYQEARRRALQRLLVTATNNDVRPTEDDLHRVQVILESATELTTLIEFLVPDCRDKSLALTHIEDAQTRANRGIYLKNPVGGRRPALVDVGLDDEMFAGTPEGE